MARTSNASNAQNKKSSSQKASDCNSTQRKSTQKASDCNSTQRKSTQKANNSTQKKSSNSK